ncbi:MAG: hypothetical protein LUH16_02910 [Clostridiales bacterium]|nr:hypothetical protein [Clostridiales bacterium]
MNLSEYAKLHPVDDQESNEMSDVVAAYRAQLQKAFVSQNTSRSAQRMMQEISIQLERNDSPQAILHLAIQCIAILTDDQAWAESCDAYVQDWEGLSQQSVFCDDISAQLDAQQDALCKQVESLQRRLKKEVAKIILL